MKITVIQLNSQYNKEQNINTAEQLIIDSLNDNPDLIVLPESFTFLDINTEHTQKNAETFPDGETYKKFQDLAKSNKVAIHCGSMFEQDGDNYYNTTVVFDSNGQQVAKYRKIHLFDVDIPSGISYRESDTCSAGKETVVYELNGVKIGCSICYDLRFPELFAQLRNQGADIIILPSAFTFETGKAHWEVLARARAIETQTYFVAVNQCGTYSNGERENYGNSMIIDPWGEIITKLDNQVGFTSGEIDLEKIKNIRQKLPIEKHHKLK